jgi:hypothetical protein
MPASTTMIPHHAGSSVIVALNAVALKRLRVPRA